VKMFNEKTLLSCIVVNVRSSVFKFSVHGAKSQEICLFSLFKIKLGGSLITGAHLFKCFGLGLLIINSARQSLH